MRPRDRTPLVGPRIPSSLCDLALDRELLATLKELDLAVIEFGR